MWVIPPEHSGEFVAHMEDVLEVYQMPYDPQVPMVCMDAQPVQLLKETRQSLPAAPGQPEQVDDEYERHGTAHIFMCTEPLNGTRHVRVTAHRTAVDWAHEIRDLLEVRSPEAARGRLVCANLNTQGRGSLYEAFPPAQARRLASRLEMHHTPKHGSWLNIAEIELSVLTMQGLDRRIPRYGDAHQGNTTVGTEAKRLPKRGGLAVLHSGCPHQTQTPLPTDSKLTGY